MQITSNSYLFPLTIHSQLENHQVFALATQSHANHQQPSSNPPNEPISSGKLSGLCTAIACTSNDNLTPPITHPQMENDLITRAPPLLGCDCTAIAIACKLPATSTSPSEPVSTGECPGHCNCVQITSDSPGDPVTSGEGPGLYTAIAIACKSPAFLNMYNPQVQSADSAEQTWGFAFERVLGTQ